MVRKSKTKAETYEKYVKSLLVFITSVFLPEEGRIAFECLEAPFLDEELYKIKPIHMSRHLELLAYGKQNPDPDMKPTQRRAEGLRFVKKAVSWWMPNKDLQWNPQTKMGNPTKSRLVNECIAEIALRECRGGGKKSGAKRDLKREEFKKTLKEVHRVQKNVDR